MKDDHENYTYTRRAFFRLPEYIFHVFKTHERRKSISSNNSFTFIVHNEWSRKELSLKIETTQAVKRLFSLSNNSKLYNNLIQSGFSPNLKNYLSYHQLCKYKKCLEYIKEYGLPNHYSYYVLDFLASTGTKFLHLSEENIFLNISVRYILNIRAAYSGVSTPKPKETLYNTIPRAFSPLFFELLQFSGTVLKGKKVRKEFEECLILSFADHLKNINHKILQYNNPNEINFLLEQELLKIQNVLWSPEHLITKFNQVKIYLDNSSFKSSKLVEYLILNYISHTLGYKNSINLLKGMTPFSILNGMLKHIRFIKNSTEESKSGWNIIDSIPNKDRCIYSMLEKVSDDLNLLIKPSLSLHLSSHNKFSSKLKFSDSRKVSTSYIA